MGDLFEVETLKEPHRGWARSLDGDSLEWAMFEQTMDATAAARGA